VCFVFHLTHPRGSNPRYALCVEGKRRVAKLRLAKMSLERRLVSEGNEEAMKAIARGEVIVKEEVLF
jgi:hypothetical protein